MTDHVAFVPIGASRLILDWAPGNTCNFSCAYCHPHNYSGSMPWQTLEDSLRFVDYVWNNICIPNKQILSVIFQGGEPTLWPHLIEVCTYIKSLSSKNTVQILTNGTRSKQWWLDNVSVIDGIMVSVHYGQSNDVKIAEKFNAISDTDTDVSVHVMIDKNNFDSCVNTYNYIYDNCPNIVLIPKPLRVDISQSKLQDYTTGQLETIKNLKHKSTFTKTVIQPPMHWKDANDNISGQVNIGDLILQKKNNWNGWYCNIGIETLVVTHEGGIKSGSLCFPGIVYGNISDSEYTIPLNMPTLCKYDSCGCLTDLQTTKTKFLESGKKYIDNDVFGRTYKIATRD